MALSGAILKFVIATLPKAVLLKVSKGGEDQDASRNVV